jgi:hypothetical protein
LHPFRSRSNREYEFILITEDAKKLHEFAKEKKCMSCKPEDSKLKQFKFYDLSCSGVILSNDIPRKDQFYLFHPHDDKECIPFHCYREVVSSLKANEIKVLLLRLGAKKISYKRKQGTKDGKKMGGKLGVTGLGGADVQFEKTSDVNIDEAEAFEIAEPETDYILLASGSGKQDDVEFDESRIGQGLKFITDPDLKDIIELRTKYWTIERTVSNHFHQQEFLSATANVLASYVEIGGKFESKPERETSMTRSVTFFPKSVFAGELRLKLRRKDNQNEVYGKKVEEGPLFIQNEATKGWDPCLVTLRAKGILLSYPHDDSKRKGKQRWFPLDRDRLEKEVKALPDDARRSQFSKMFPMSIPSIFKDEDMGEFRKGRLILSAESGREMWRWAALIRWLYHDGKPSLSAQISVKVKFYVSWYCTNRGTLYPR